MNIASKLFSLSLGVEPNKAALKDLSDTLNSAIVSLSEKQKAFEHYANSVEGHSIVAPPISPPTKQQVEGTKLPVVWQIPQSKLKELQWKRAQLRQFERERNARAMALQKQTKPVNPSQKKTSPFNPPSGEKSLNKGSRNKVPQSNARLAKSSQMLSAAPQASNTSKHSQSKSTGVKPEAQKSLNSKLSKPAQRTSA